MGIYKKSKMEEEIISISDRIVKAINHTTNDYDAKEIVISIIEKAFITK
jgi:hypothetical protein